jgi:G3E family GTPase
VELLLDRAPVVLVVGMLGSGKTSLMRGLVRACREDGRPFGLIVNDYAAPGVDTSLLRDYAGPLAPLREIVGNCLCCSGSDALVDAVESLACAGRDPILIEASGVADAVEIVDTLTTDRLVDVARVERIVAVVDASRYLRQRSEGKVVRRQIAMADVVILNKSDVASPAEIDRCRRAIRQDNAQAPVLTAQHCEVDLAALLPPPGDGRPLGIQRLLAARTRAAALGDGTLGPLPHPTYHAVTLTLPTPLDPEGFRAFLQRLPTTVLRAKGYVPLGRPPQLHVFHYVEGQVDLAPYVPPEQTTLMAPASPDPYAVFIGPAVDERALRASLEGCRV